MLQTLEVLAPKVVSPLYNSRLAAELIFDGLPILVERDSTRKRCDWKKITQIRPDAKPPVKTRARLVKAVRMGGPSWVPPQGAELENVWMLLGYLSAVGPLPVAICAPRPFTLNGRQYYGQWGEDDDGTWGLYLIRPDSRYIDNFRRLQESQILVSEPVQLNASV